ncbi:MAG: LamG domain-containing protein, partial [Ignavibacteria bacterium]
MKLRLLSILLIIVLSAFTSKNANSFLFWNQAGLFNGATSYVTFPNSSTLNITGSFSIEGWINPVNASSPALQIIAEKRTGTVANGYTLFLSGGKAAIMTNQFTRLTGTTVIPNNLWTHIAATYNSVTNEFSIYINNTLDAAATVGGASPSPSMDSLRIGKGNAGNNFKGAIDEFRVWNRGLTAAEITRYFRTSLGA